MKTKILGIALAVALLLAPMALIAPARAQERNVVYASQVELTIGNATQPVEYKLPVLINMETGGSFTYGGVKYTIKPNDGAVYDATGTTQVGLVTQTRYYTLSEGPRETSLDVYVDLPVYYTSATIEGGPKAGTYDVHVGPDDTTVTIAGIVFNIAGTSLSGKETDAEGNTITYTGTLSGGRYEVKTEEDFSVQVTLSATGEPVNNATVAWDDQEVQTDPFGWATLTAPFVESEEDYGSVEAIKVYEQESIERSAYGASEYPIYVVPYDLYVPDEFLAWWSHFALTEESQAMYEAAEILGDWGANLSEDVTVWSNIFGPKGGSLAEFIRGFPQFMVDRGAALEATKNMLDTIWALFTLLPAFVLALPALLQTAPMRMLQFWPALFTNLDLVLTGISQMVIDLGVFMMSLAPSVLMLLPEMFERLPNIGPEAMNIVLTAVELFVQIIPALSQYLPAAIAAIPAFFIQMLIALFFNAVAIFSTAADETIATLKNLFRSWPLFPAGIAAGILAVAPALMMLPSLAPLVLIGRAIENSAGALGEWMQSLREMPSTMLDPILHAFGTNPATLVLRYVLVFGYCGVTSFLFLPAIGIAIFALGLSLIPLGILTISLALAPFAALLMFVPIVGWIWDIIWAAWMSLSVIASWAVTVPGTLADALEYLVMRATQVCTMPGYAVGWCLQGVLDIVEIGFVEDLTNMLKDIVAKFPEIIAYIQPIINALMQSAGTATAATAGGGSSLLGLLGTIGPFLAGAAGGAGLGAAGGAAVGATGGAVATGAAAAVSPIP